MCTMGFGTSSESRMRIPKPPQNRITFMLCPLLLFLRDCYFRGSFFLARRIHATDPLMRVLFVVQSSSEYWRGKRYCVRKRRNASTGAQFFQPSLTAKMAILLGAQLIREPARRQFHVVVREDCILCNIALEFTGFDQSFRQVTPVTHLVGVDRLTIRHVHSVIVEHLARFQIAFGDRTNLNHWPTERPGNWIPQQRNPGYRIRHLEMDQMIR